MRGYFPRIEARFSPHTSADIHSQPIAVLDPGDWMEIAAHHRDRVTPWIEPRLTRRAQGDKHPVDDFLFDYYSFRAGQLRRWHPGHGVALAGSDQSLHDYLTHPDYQRIDVGATTSSERLVRHHERINSAIRLMQATSSREPHFGCFGLHEWAMLYRASTDEVRHNTWPLRLTIDDISDVVDDQGLRCTHFDAFRFYTAAARPLNENQLTRASTVAREQPGCLHATMDLYKWAFMFSPFTPSDLIADCFELARDVRTVDMRASPYDFRDIDLEPIEVETTHGRREYVSHQREIATRGEELRKSLIHALKHLEACLTPSQRER